MKLAYFRKSKRSLEEIKKVLTNSAEAKNIKIANAEMFPSGKGFFIPVMMSEWVEEVSRGIDPNLFNFIPFAFYAYETEGGVFVGAADPRAIAPIVGDSCGHDHGDSLGGSDHKHDHVASAVLTGASEAIRAVINEASGAGDRKVKSVKLYSTMTCPYCRMEKEWLEKIGIKFDYILVDMNPAAGEEMVRKTGQAGVPVTEIEYDSGDAEFVVGFDKEELSGLFGVRQG